MHVEFVSLLKNLGVSWAPSQKIMEDPLGTLTDVVSDSHVCFIVVVLKISFFFHVWSNVAPMSAR